MTIESQNYGGLNSPDPKMRYQTVCDLISVGADKDRYLLVDLLDDPADKVRGASRFGYAATGAYPDKIPALDLRELGYDPKDITARGRVMQRARD